MGVVSFLQVGVVGSAARNRYDFDKLGLISTTTYLA